MTKPSSENLHPGNGARFVLTRRELDADSYDVAVYSAGGAAFHAVLQWSRAGQATVVPALPVEWVQQETLKLARVLKQSPRERLSRWRSEPGSAPR